MMEPQRIRELNDTPERSGKYVLYWMQQSQRTRFNHALEHAIARANALDLPVIVCFGLMDDYPEANARHYAFMLDGLADVSAGLKRRGIEFLARRGDPAQVALQCALDAALVVCDRGYLRHQKRWRDEVADHAPCRVVEVESDIVVPVDVASDKAEFAARTLRPKIHKHWRSFMKPLRATRLKNCNRRLRLRGTIDVTRPASALEQVSLDRSVPPVADVTGGERTARKRLAQFIRRDLTGYAKQRNDPAQQRTSHLSPYLHFGQISPVEIALTVMRSKAPTADRDAFLEELVVRRELSANFCHFTPDYDRYDALPAWARKTLKQHRCDRRRYVYSRRQLESARTHDPYWNAAQTEMVKTGYMHNYMRMYWGKKIIEWKRTPQQAYADAIYLNNKYFIDGRDPNAWTNVAWLFGLHDRPWGPARPIFGLVRYMSASGLTRKFDMESYVKWVEAIEV